MVLVSPPSFSRPPRALAMLMPGNDGGDGLTPSFLMARPQSPAHLNALGFQHWSMKNHLQSCKAFPIQDAHHATTPLLPVPLFRSVAHEMPREPYRLRCGGSYRRVCTCSCWHIHIGNVPGHHHHVSARHTRHLMLHYAPRRYWLLGRMTSCHPVCTAMP